MADHQQDQIDDDQTDVIEGEADAILDDDDLALAELEKEAAAGEGEADGEGEGAAQAEGEGAAKPEPDPAKAGEGEGEGAAQAEGEGKAQAEPDTPSIPKPRFDQVAQERDQWRDTALRMQGQIEALQAFRQQDGGQQQQSQQPAQLTPEQQIASYRAQQTDNAKKFDDGEISMAEYEAERQRLDDEIWNTRQKATAQPALPQPDQGRQHADLYLNEKFDQLEAQHPYTKLITSDEDWAFLAQKATAELKAEGMQAIDPDNPVHELAVRTRMAELTDRYGPVMTGKTADQAQPNTGGQQQQQQPGGQPGKLSPQAQARADKLDMANNLPPDIGAAGGGDAQSDVWSPERVAALSEEEFENLPAATRNAIERKFGDGASP